MTSINLSDKKYENFILMYAAAAAIYICVAHVYSILSPDLLLAEPVTGGLIVWVHLHTLGVITPLFMGIGFYNLHSRYNEQNRASQILHHFIMLYVPLPFFLFMVFKREGSLWLTFIAFLIFSSVVYYIYIYVKALWNVKKENRNFEFWTDAVSLYFLFQAAMFGFALAANLSYHFFRRDIAHSLRLHSHSGIIGFWLLQFLNMIFRSRWLDAINNSKSAMATNEQNKYLKYSLIFSGVGIFIWTSVHDRFPWAFYFFYFSVGITLLFLALHLFKIKFSFRKTGSLNRNGQVISYMNILMFMFVAFAIAGYMIFSGSQDFINHNHLPFIYMFTIFYGAFIFLPFEFIIKNVSGSILFKGDTYIKVKWAHALYLILAILFIISVIIENIFYMRILQLFMFADFLYIVYTFYRAIGLKSVK